MPQEICVNVRFRYVGDKEFPLEYPSKLRVLMPYAQIAVPLAANISYVDFSVRSFTRMHGRTQKSEVIPFLAVLPFIKRRLMFGPSLVAVFSVGSLRFSIDNCKAGDTSSIGRRKLDDTSNGI